MKQITHKVSVNQQKKPKILLLSIIYYLIFGIASRASAQTAIVPDNTLSSNTNVNNAGEGIYEITGGTRPENGANLFHSFSDFSVNTGDTARFIQDTGIKNIFTRITGSFPSLIDGTIETLINNTTDIGQANLFILNPHGILFGPNASLNIGGSLIGSTANSIKFIDGTEFSATNPASNPVLTISVPFGLQYGANPGEIQVQGTGNNLFLDDPFVIKVFRPDGLRVNDGQTLALLGGNVSLDGANLTANDGRVELGSVAGESLVTFTPTNLGWEFKYEQVNNFQDISLSNTASVEVSGNQGGIVQVQGREISLTDGSAILADTQGNGTGGQLLVRGSETVAVIGSSSFTPPPRGEQTFPAFFFPSRLSTDVDRFPTSTGTGGNIFIETPSLLVGNGGQISSGTFSAGNAGSLHITAQTVELFSGSRGTGASGLFTPVAPGATGRGGLLNINTENLTIADGALAFAGTFGIGNGGKITINAAQIELAGTSPGGSPSGISVNVLPDATGDGGDIEITTDDLVIDNGARLGVNTFSSGNAGQLTVKAKHIEVSGGSPLSGASGMFNDVEVGATGKGGDLTLETESLLITGGAQIAALTFGSGDAGNLTIKAQEVSLIGTSPSGFPSALLATVEEGATGNGGNLIVETERLEVSHGAQIAVSTAGKGKAGDLLVNASESLELTGTSPFTRSGLFSSAIVDTGDGGDVTVITDQLNVKNGATINVGNFQSQNLKNPGQGAAGNLTVQARVISLENDSILTAEALVGNKGNINLSSENLVLRQGSSISTNAQRTATGGNIVINTDNLVLLESSNISANSVANFAGRVSITTQGIFLSDDSKITASSELGEEFNGIVEINSPDVDPSTGLVQLSSEVVDSSNQVVTGCQQDEGNVLALAGRGGLPEVPNQSLRGRSVWQDLRPLEASNQVARSNVSEYPPSNIVEAQGWVISGNGKVVLTVRTSKATPHIPAMVEPNCALE